MTFTLETARALATRAHADQVDKLGEPYMHHVEAVAAGVADFELEVQIAAMLHDVIEDSDITIDDLRAAGVPERSLWAIELVSRNLHPELDYHAGIERICGSRDATLVKISDNAHNSLPARTQELIRRSRQPTNPRYAAAREVLYASVPHDDVVTILTRANPALLAELQDATQDQR